MFCPNCGNNINDSASFCNNCGYKIKKSGSTIMKLSKRHLAIAIAIVLFVVVLFFITKNNKNKNYDFIKKYPDYNEILLV